MSCQDYELTYPALVYCVIIHVRCFWVSMCVRCLRYFCQSEFLRSLHKFIQIFYICMYDKSKKRRMKGWNWSAEGVERVRGCQPCFLVPCVIQPTSQAFATTEGSDLMIPHMSWPTCLSRSDDWIPSQNSLHPAMFRQASHIATEVPMLFTYDSWPCFYRCGRRQVLNPTIPIVVTIVPFQWPICIWRWCRDGTA